MTHSIGFQRSFILVLLALTALSLGATNPNSRAAFIFQHGQKPDDYLYAHVLATTALGKGFEPAKWLSAATLDRYLRSVKQPQIFGTQFGSLFDDGDLDPYNKELLSDRMRQLWCVAPYSKQLEIQDDVKSGREFTSTRICPIPD
jgi:hypothetical protein